MAANVLKGEIPFDAGEKTYTFILDFNALCDLESEIAGLMDGKAELKSPATIRSVFHAGLQCHHPEVDVLSAGRIIHEIGLAKAGELVRDSFKASFPDAEDKKPKGPQTGRQKPGAGQKP